MSIAFVKNIGTGNAVSSTTAVITVPAGGVAVGDLIVVRVAVTYTSITGIADTKGNTYATFASANTQGTWVCIVKVPLVSGDTITVTFGTSGSRVVAADQFSGLAAPATKDVASATATGTSTTPSISITPARAEVLMFAHLEVEGGTADTFTQDSDNSGGDTWHTLTRAQSGTSRTTNAAYKITTSAVAQTYNPTLGTSRTWSISLSAIQAATWVPKIVVV